MCNCASRITACRRAYSDLPNAVRIADARGSNARGTVFPVGDDAANEPRPVIAHTVAFLPHYVAFHAACIFADFFPPTNQTRANVPLTATPLAHYRQDIRSPRNPSQGRDVSCAQKTTRNAPTAEKTLPYSRHAGTETIFLFVAKPRARASTKWPPHGATTLFARFVVFASRLVNFGKCMHAAVHFCGSFTHWSFVLD